MKFDKTEVWGFEHALRGMRNPKNSWEKSDSRYGYADVKESLKTCNTFKNGIPGALIGTYDGVGCYATGSRSLVEYYAIGKEDMKLAQSLIRAGSEHRKFMRQIFVSVDITAPLYWWKEFDTYKVGTVANSTSTMHKILSQPITFDCFETDDYHSELGLIDDVNIGLRVDCFIDDLEQLRQMCLYYIDEEKKAVSEEGKLEAQKYQHLYWKELIRWLPESWLQTRTVTMSYENLFAICGKGQRRFHKLNEWSGKYDSELSNFISWARTLPYARELIFIDEVK